MKEGNAIEVNHVKKSFKLFSDKGHTLKEKILFRKRRQFEQRVVLDDISFEVKKGEAIGFVGQNGCGKSTTLKLLTKIMYPDVGTIEMKGRVSSLLELGAGFHPDMSGRENIFINASIFGLTKREIEQRLDDIIAFSELEDYIDNPVRTYSSGMYMRLAFAVAINVDADILLIDEILAVGDANFQSKCFNKLREIKAAGTTIVIVSHSLGQIEQICERSIWLQDGKIHSEGKPKEVHMEYLEFMGQLQQVIAEKEQERQEGLTERNENHEMVQRAAENLAERCSCSKPAAEQKRWGNGKAKIQQIQLFNQQGKKQSAFRTGESIELRIQISVKETIKNAVFGIGIFRNDGVNCYGTNTRIDQLEKFDISKNGTVSLKINNCNLLPGKYLLDVAIECDDGIPVDYYREACTFELYSAIGDIGVTRLEHTWNMKIN